jgi:hypothetical protein
MDFAEILDTGFWIPDIHKASRPVSFRIKHPGSIGKPSARAMELHHG